MGLDLNIIGVAIPRITTELKSLSDIAWYGSAYMLSTTAFQPLFGNLYKLFNTKIIYLMSFAIFETGSVICAAAPTSPVLIFGRAVLGLGAAGILQGTLAIIAEIVDPNRVPLFQGIVSSSMIASSTLGPVIGGALTQFVSWRWCFWINVPAGVILLVAVSIVLPFHGNSDHDEDTALSTKLRRIDSIGLIVFLGLITCILLVLTWAGQAYPWHDQKIIGLLVGFGILTLLFIYWLVRQGENALLPPRILRQRTVYMGFLALSGFALLSVVIAYYLPIFFQSAQGVSILQSGLQFIAFIGPQLAALAITGAIVSQWGHCVPYMILGGIIATVGAGLLTTVELSTPTTKWASYLVLTGIGTGMGFQIPYMALPAVLDPRDVTIGNAILGVGYHFAGAVGTAIGQNLLISGLYVAIPRHADTVSVESVIQAGATGLANVATSATELNAIRTAYVEAVRRTLILALAGGILAIPASCGMEWVNIKLAAEKQLQKHSTENIAEAKIPEALSKEAAPAPT
ncbi:major facilitator superfamily domain-containing protein [Nemania sp. FL0916]|nr:major facilitator superfamily domain-containing protein [Nemania sp. FL0916]